MTLPLPQAQSPMIQRVRAHSEWLDENANCLATIEWNKKQVYTVRGHIESVDDDGKFYVRLHERGQIFVLDAAHVKVTKPLAVEMPVTA